MAESDSGSRSDRCVSPVVGQSPGETDPTAWSSEALAALQALIETSRRAAGQALRDSFDRPERRMDAAELVAFWNGTGLKAMATVGPDGAPHLAPVHAQLVNGRLRTTIYEDAVRRRDLRSNPRVSLTTWGPGGAVAILYGRAREVPGSGRDTRAGASGRPRRTVALDIEITRVYAMRARLPAPA